MTPVSLRRRLVAVMLVVLLASTAALATASALALRAQLLGRLDDQLTQAASRVADPPSLQPSTRGGEVHPSPPPDDGTGDGAQGETLRLVVPWLGQDVGTIVVVYDDGAVARAGYLDQDGGFQDLTTAQVEALESVPSDEEPHDAVVPSLGSYRAIATTTRDGEPSVLAVSTTSVAQTVGRYVAVEVAIGVGGLLVAGVAGTWFVRRSLRPLDTVAAAAGRVSELELSEGAVAAIPRVPEAYTDERTEVGQVGAALNRLLDNVEQSLTARHESETQVRRFVADASHELRTPLASVRGYAELVRRSPDLAGGRVPADTLRALDRIEAEAGRMSALVEDLLLLARLDAGRPLESAPVDLVALAADAVADAHAAGPTHRWELDLPGGTDGGTDESAADGSDGGSDDEPPELWVTGDEARLRQVLANLLGNARVHTPPGTRVVLSLASDGGDAVVAVSDEGPGIPAALRPELFRRFSRGDDARTRTGGSTGLGLSIVQGIVTAHGGTVTVTSRTEGEATPSGTGTCVEVRLPAAAS